MTRISFSRTYNTCVNIKCRVDNLMCKANDRYEVFIIISK